MASSLGYRLVFAIFPALIVLVAVLDLLGRFKPVVEEAIAGSRAALRLAVASARGAAQHGAAGSTPAWAMLAFGGLIASGRRQLHRQLSVVGGAYPS